jgi:DNA-binding NarL/FixJ family response regulator
MVIEGLRAVLERNDGLEVVGEVTDGKQVLDHLEKDPSVHMVILDINMPELDGISCARAIKDVFPDVKVIILTMYAQRSFVDEIVKLQIEGCLLKNNTGKDLLDAIARVRKGELYYDHIKDFVGENDVISNFKLSNREIEVISALSEGLTSDQIAEKLFISEHTVKTHRKNILKKLGINNTGALIQYAIKNHII